MALPKLKAPAGDGELLAVPPLKEWPGLVERNRKLSQSQAIAGAPLDEWQRISRWNALTIARLFFRGSFRLELGDPSWELPWIVTGHQPELFHAGVWIKNFAADRLAKTLDGAGLNLVVDSDLADSVAIRVPNAHTGDADELPFDLPSTPMPYAERPVLDEDLLCSFPERVEASLGSRPEGLGAWSQAVAMKKSKRLGDQLVFTRHLLESQWSVNNLEAPLAHIAITAAFARFAAVILRDLSHFVDVYNRALLNYRKRHRLRGQNHPVPALQRIDDWYEAPLWAWRHGEHRRLRLFARDTDTGTRLAAFSTQMDELPVVLPSGPLFPADDHFEVPHEWWHLKEWRVAPRALMTTLYSRLCLADLFIHGLGGGLYDEMTDEIIRGYFGIEPPAYAILTGTLRLPDPQANARGSPMCSTAELRRALRDAHYNPDRHLPAAASSHTLRLVRDKAAAIAQVPPTKPDRMVRFNRLHELNEQLRPKTDRERQRLETQLQQALAAEARASVFHDREYAFILHSKANMQRLIDQLIFT